MHRARVPKEGKRLNQSERKIEKILAQDFPKLKKDIKPQKQEALQIPNEEKNKTTSPSEHIIAKLLTTINKGDFFYERKKHFLPKAPIKMTINFSTKNSEN